MKPHKISIALLIALSSMAFAGSNNESLKDALLNTKFNSELKAWYWDKTDETSKFNNENITNFALELGLKTGDLYGFYLGSTAQIAFAPIGKKNAKLLYNGEQNTKGIVLSQLHLGYKISNSDIKIGRQFINTPLVAGNGARILKESFEGATANIKDIENNDIFLGYVYKFQGRTSSIMGDENGKYPKFKDRITLGGVGPKAHKFDGLYYLGLTNKSFENLDLTAQYSYLNNVEFAIPNMKDKNGDIHLYYTEANYKVPFENFNLKFDANFRGSKTSGQLEERNFNGQMYGIKAGVYDLNGFNLIAAATTVSKNKSVIMSAGLGGNSYTFLPVRGGHLFTSTAGMTTYKFQTDYDLSKIGIKNLKTSAAYVFSKHSTPNKQAGMNPANVKREYNGYSLALNYKVPCLEGLSTNLMWVSLNEKKTINNKTDKSKIDELWVKLSYKF